MPRATPQVPKAWPLDVRYLTVPHFSKALSKEQLKTLCNPLSCPKENVAHTSPGGPSSLVRICPIALPTHPAKGQAGLFAAQHLPPDTFILFYLGYVHTQAESDAASTYDLSLDREQGIAIDATVMGNEARFINDYRGIRCGPNAEFREVWANTGKQQLEKRMGVFVLSAGKARKRVAGIKAGEEILVSYGKAFWR